MEEAEYCDRIVIQDAGKLLALGTPGQVRTQAGATPERAMTMEEAFIGIVESGRNGTAKGMPRANGAPAAPPHAAGLAETQP